MKRSKWITAAALLAVTAIFSAAPARAGIVTLTITDGGQSATAQADSTTGGIVLGSVVLSGGATGTFSSALLAGETTLAFTGTVGGIVFNMSTAATSNTPGTPTLAFLNLSSNTINNTPGNGTQTFTVFTSATGYTMPTGVVQANFANSGTLTTGEISNGSFSGSADGYNPTPLMFAASGSGKSVAGEGPTSFPTITGPFTISETLTATLADGTKTATLGGTLTLTAVPEPSTVAAALSGVMLVSLASVRRKFRNRA